MPTSPTSWTSPATSAPTWTPRVQIRVSLSSCGASARMPVASWCMTPAKTRMPTNVAPQTTPKSSTKNGVPVTTAAGMPAAAAARARTNVGCTAAAPASPMTTHA